MKEKLKIIKKGNKGITLIALVVTIIVLIILAGITVNLLLGENGLLQRAKDSKTVYDTSSLKEKMSLLLMDYKIERETTGITLQEYLTKKNVEYEVDGQNVKIEEDGYIVTINAITLEMEEPVKTTKTAKITLNKNIVEPEEAFTATLTLGEDVDITKCKYKLEKANVTVEKQDVTTGVESRTINLTAPNEKGEYYLYLLVGYKNSDETLLKKAKVKVDVPVTGVTLNETSLNMYVGESTSNPLTATVEPTGAEQGVTWSTSNSSIATVDQTGKVTAVGGGTAQIIATSTEDISKTATCTVTVESLASIEITTPPTKTEYYIGETLDLTGLVVTANYESGATKVLESNQYTTTPANESIIQVGTTKVSVRYTEGSITKTSNINNITILGIKPVSAEASYEYSSQPVTNSYDDSKETTWGTSPNGNANAIYTFDKAYSFKNIEIYIGGVSSSTFNETIAIYGSNDKTTYTQISKSITVNQNATTNFNITNTSEFKYIKVDISNGRNGGRR